MRLFPSVLSFKHLTQNGCRDAFNEQVALRCSGGSAAVFNLSAFAKMPPAAVSVENPTGVAFVLAGTLNCVL